MSSFLDNVTTVLLMTPVTIRLCEVMQLNPVPILMSMIIFSNIGESYIGFFQIPYLLVIATEQLWALNQKQIVFIIFTWFFPPQVVQSLQLAIRRM